MDHFKLIFAIMVSAGIVQLHGSQFSSQKETLEHELREYKTEITLFINCPSYKKDARYAPTKLLFSQLSIWRASMQLPQADLQCEEKCCTEQDILRRQADQIANALTAYAQQEAKVDAFIQSPHFAKLKKVCRDIQNHL